MTAEGEGREKKGISLWMRRDARAMFGNMCNAGQRASGPGQRDRDLGRRSVCGGRRARIAHARVSALRRHAARRTLFRLRIPSDLAPPSLSSLLAASAPSAFNQTTMASAYMDANLPRPCFFAILFAQSPSHPRRTETVGDGGDGGCPEGAAIGIGTHPVSLVTAPHKGIAL